MILPVRLAEQSYDIILDKGALEQAGELLQLDRKVFVVTDDGVPKEYAEKIAAQCAEPVVVTLPHGEASKSFAQLERLLGVMLEHSFSRKDCVLAVGGGVVGDLAGFTAACYMRGVDFYNVPTTLLAQVDSSIGGKTAVDFHGVKNVVGAFHQPKRVLIDPSVLDTLAPRQLRAGLAEAVKMATTSDATLFELLEQSDDLYADLPEIIRRSLCVKQAVVEQDPQETGLRRVLNFGHTIGHAVESCENGALLHGECVAIGMPPMCGEKVRNRLIRLLERYELPTQTTFSAAQLLPYLLHDKKRLAENIRIVKVEEIGSFAFQDMKPVEILERLGNPS